MSLPERYEDLAQLLAELRDSVRDSRYLWCKLGTRFETTATRCKGLRIGGAWSPIFLRDPGTLQLMRPRVVFVETALNVVQEWLPLMESVQREYESLLLVTDEIDPVLLATFIINLRRETMSCCVVHSAPVSEHPGSGSMTAEKPERPRLSLWESTFGGRGNRSEKASAVTRSTEWLGKGRHSPPKGIDGVPLGEEVLVRKAAAVVIPSAEEWPASLEDVVIVEVGGEYYEDQQARLRFANEWLREQDKRDR